MRDQKLSGDRSCQVSLGNVDFSGMKRGTDPEKLAWLFFKINLLVVGLGLVVYGIYFVNHRGLPRPLSAMVGATEVLCPTRIVAIQWPDGIKLQQVGNEWQRLTSSGDKRAVNFLAIEKWFASNCGKPVVFVAEAPLEITFVTGKTTAILIEDKDLLAAFGQLKTMD
jgi:hypothetical protein